MHPRKMAFAQLFFSVGLITVVLSLVFTNSPIARSSMARSSQEPQQQMPNVSNGSGGNLPDRTIRIHDLQVSSGRSPKLNQVTMMVLLTNIGKRRLTMQSNDFMLTAEGDIFGQSAPPTPSASMRT